MPDAPRILEIADYALLAVGAAGSLAIILRLAMQRRLRDALQLPAPTPNALEAVDVLAAFIALVLIPGLFNMAISSIWPAPALTFAQALAPATQSAGSALPAPSQTLAMALGQIAACLVFCIIARRRFPGGLSGWGLSFPRPLATLGIAALVYIAVWPWCFALLFAAVKLLELLSPGFEIPEHDTIRQLLGHDLPAWARGLTFFNALVLAAVVEELFFRGLVQPLLAKAAGRTWPAVILTAFAFGMFHYPLVQTVLPLTLFGIVLGCLRARTGSLALPIALHMVFNAKTLLWIALGGHP